MARKRRGRRDPHPPPRLGHPADDDHGLPGDRTHPGFPLAGGDCCPVRIRHGAHLRRIRALAEPQGRLLVREGATVDRRGDGRGGLRRDPADRLCRLDRCRQGGRGRRLRRRRFLRSPGDTAGARQLLQREVPDGDRRALHSLRQLGWRIPAGSAGVTLGEGLLSRREARAFQGALLRAAWLGATHEGPGGKPADPPPEPAPEDPPASPEAAPPQ